MTTKFALIADAHFGFPRFRGDTNFECASIVKKIIENINREPGVEFVVQLGDMINENPSHPISAQDLLSLQHVIKIFDKLEAPVFHLVGNHDLATLSRQEVQEALGYEELFYSFQTRIFHCIVLATQSPGNKDIKLFPGELEWLSMELKSSSKPVLIFCHQQIAKHSLENNYWFKGNPEGAFIEEGETVERILKDSGKVHAVFNGHMHWNNLVYSQELPFFTIQSMIEDFRHDGTPASAYAIVEISENQILVDVRGNDPKKLIAEKTLFPKNIC